MPSEQRAAVREALDRIARSDPFRKAPQLSAFLTFVVEKELAGEAQEIKGYTIATQALGRAEGFDPQTDPIVRVEAGRLRRALDAYYAEAGLNDPVRITIPRGTYVPEFSFRPGFGEPEEGDTSSDWAETAPQPSSWPGSTWPRPSVIAAAILLLLAGLACGFVWWLTADGSGYGRFRGRGGSIRDPRPVVEVAPVETSLGLPSPSMRRLRDQLLDALAHFEYLAVTDRPPKAPAEGEHYLVNLRQGEAREGNLVTARLTHATSGRVAWVRTYAIEPGPDGAAEDKLAGQIATAIATPGGALHSDLRRWVRVAPPVACVLRANAYWLAPNPTAYGETRSCLEAIAAADPDAAIVRAMLASFYLDQYRRGIDPQDDPLEKASQVARRALEISPGNPRAHLAMMGVLLARGDPQEALQYGEQAVALNPYDATVRADLGARYVQTGHYQRGLALLQAAADAAPVEPLRYEFYRFLGAYMLGDDASARKAASRTLSAGDPLGLTSRAIAAVLAKQEDEARTLVAQLANEHPAFARAPSETFARYGFAPEVVARLVDGLRRAGLRGV